MRRARKDLIDLTDRRFGHLTVVSYVPRPGSRSDWLAVCDCGESGVFASGNLRGGRQKTCGLGCPLNTQIKSKAAQTHGESGVTANTKEWRTWRSMIQRCTDPHVKNYAGYGGRGISVCQRWRHDYDAFLADMGRAPSSRYSIDRVDNNGNYEPGNCRWATMVQQQRNKRSTVWISLAGEVVSLADACEKTGVNYSAAQSRIAHGWDREQAVVTPIGGHRRYANRRTP